MGRKKVVGKKEEVNKEICGKVETYSICNPPSVLAKIKIWGRGFISNAAIHAACLILLWAHHL
jgi:hypothetical protein